MENRTAINLPNGQNLREKERHLLVFASECRGGCVKFDRDQVRAGLIDHPNLLIDIKF
jgi:hypothetical protein